MNALRGGLQPDRHNISELWQRCTGFTNSITGFFFLYRKEEQVLTSSAWLRNPRLCSPTFIIKLLPFWKGCSWVSKRGQEFCFHLLLETMNELCDGKIKPQERKWSLGPAGRDEQSAPSYGNYSYHPPKLRTEGDWFGQHMTLAVGCFSLLSENSSV